MQLHSRRWHAMARCRLLIAASALSLAALLFLTRIPPGLIALPLQLGLGTTPARALLVPPHRLALGLGAVRGTTTPAASAHQSPLSETEAVLLPDWEVLVLLHPDAAAALGAGNATSVFRGGASPLARALGRLHMPEAN